MPIFECSRCNHLTYSSAIDAAGVCARCGTERHRVLDGGFRDARASLRSLAEADHATLAYDDPAGVAPFCARFLTEGIDAGECVVATVADDLRRAITALLAPDVEALVGWRRPSEVYGDFDPDRVASTYDELIAGEERTTRILSGIDGECAVGVDAEELGRLEATAHAIITARGATAVCVYDTRTIPGELVAAAWRRHPLAVEDGAVRRNEQFEYEPA